MRTSSLINLLILGLIFLVINGCVTTKAVELGTGQKKRPPVPQEKVLVYRTADQVPGKYEEIALLLAEGDAIWTDEVLMIESMKEKAGRMGANAIILDAISEPSDEIKVISVFLGVYGVERKGKAVAVYVFSIEENKLATNTVPLVRNLL